MNQDSSDIGFFHDLVENRSLSQCSFSDAPTFEDTPVERPGSQIATEISDTDWESHAHSKLVECRSEELRSLRPWNNLWSFGTGLSPGDLLRQMLGADETLLNELNMPLPPPESEIPEHEDVVRAKRSRMVRTDGDVRSMAILKIRDFLLMDCVATELGRLLVPKKGLQMDLQDVERSIKDSFSQKASSALYKRACALVRFSKWSCAQKVNPLRPGEQGVYDYLRFLEETGSGATAGSSFLEAMRFIHGVAKFTEGDFDRTLSSRVTGLAHSS